MKKSERKLCTITEEWERMQTRKEKEEEEKLYICDHAEECGSKVCGHIRPHTCNASFCGRTYCISNEMIGAKCIPYKEKEETKRMWIIHECEIDLEGTHDLNICIYDGYGNRVYKADAELIPDDWITDKIMAEGSSNEFRTIHIKPPTKQETVDEVIERMPLVTEHRKAFLNGDNNATMSKYLSNLEAWQKDLEAARKM